MTKTKKTKEIEYLLWRQTTLNGSVFGVREVTVGYIRSGLENTQRVDYVTSDTNGEIRAYEIKTSVSDLHSKAKLSWIGDYNYLVLSEQVFNAVMASEGKIKEVDWTSVGVMVIHDDGHYSIEKKAKRLLHSFGERVEIIESMMKAAARDAGKEYSAEWQTLKSST